MLRFLTLAVFLIPAFSQAADLNWITGNYSVLTGPDVSLSCALSDAQISRKVVKNYDAISILATGKCNDNRSIEHEAGLSLKGFEGDSCEENATHIMCTNGTSGFKLTATNNQDGTLLLKVVRFGEYSSSVSWVLRKN